ncbi:J domain-containing protein [Frankia sp. AiPs1]|uniref:J domain-containing protein n=1 Tax=Frankia sp. AiPa1 TaxID=573492 RepID=UPI00202B1E95|nr:DnaJ domain-containing protein [Frankia sp. AiPa1]MCL9762006.1 DnaJ domain-containing protein [Frankia sp. AiPa1]
MAAQPSLYEVLGIAPDASAEQIRHAYRAAARRTHPDAGGRPAAFARVRVAYDVLGDPARRHRYDLRIADPTHRPHPGGRPSRPGATGTPGASTAAGSDWTTTTGTGAAGAGAAGTGTAGTQATGSGWVGGASGPPSGALQAGADPVVRRRYLILMGIALTLFIIAGAIVRLYSVPAAMIMMMVAAVIPPIAVTVAGRPRPQSSHDPPSDGNRVR